ncbi:uncharacterized protein LOC130893969 [Diorhabda carinulata]|uniref:uncharacterized protein LOC130893969 n=1 Tax=Diorhabda carinulata TaxID=1163345 RepID=UPI0025A25EC2|nr:uncharacterized protein LOC130893969 [Diorhabda carinulata]
MESELRPEAPVYIPPHLRNGATRCSLDSIKSTPSPNSKESQCSRYSRKPIRSVASPNSPRPILGTKLPRPILGRKFDTEVNEYQDGEEYIGREFRRSFKRLSMKSDSVVKEDEERKKID